MGRISARVGAISGSATLAVEAKARELRAAGRDIIGFGAGEPDFPTPDHIVAAAEKACRDPRLHHYTPTAGLPELRDAIAAKTARDSGLAVDAASVVVTNGAKQAVFEAFAALLDPGDEVLLPCPWWTTYPEAVRLAGGVPVSVPTWPRDGYRVRVDELEERLSPRTKVLLFCSPANPTGAVHSPTEVTTIGSWAADRGLWVITDEIYEHLVYPPAMFTSLPVAVPEIRDRCVVVNGVAKTYAMTGWRVGWLLAPRDVARAVGDLQSHSTSNVCNVAQAAALAALTGGLTEVAEMRAAFDVRRRRMVQMLSAMPGIDCPDPEGAFYCFPSVTGMLGRPLAGRVVSSSAELAELLLELADVAVVPGEAFGTEGAVRLSYALAEGELVRGLERVAALIAS